MIYYYLVRVRFLVGSLVIIRDYTRSCLDIGKLFCFLEEVHKDNYELIFIKKLK